MANIDIDQWLNDHGMDPLWGRRMADEIKEHYPHVYEAVKLHKDVLGELELVDLVHKTLIKSFPTKSIHG